MPFKRIVVRLDVVGALIPQSARHPAHPAIADPAELAQLFEGEGADEVVIRDAAPLSRERQSLIEALERTAKRVLIPVTLAGGLDDLDDLARALHAGADKVRVDGLAMKRPELISEAARRFGRHSVSVGVNARREKRAVELALRQQGGEGAAPQPAPETEDWYRVFVEHGDAATQLDAIQWATQCAELGVGEIVVTGIDHGGMRRGYDLELTARVVEAVRLPVLASGGAGWAGHVRDAFVLAGADGAVISTAFLRDGNGIGPTKRLLSESGVAVRMEERTQPRMPVP